MTPMNLLAVFGLSLLLTALYNLFYILGSKRNTTFTNGWVIPVTIIFGIVMFIGWAEGTEVYKALITFMETPLW